VARRRAPARHWHFWRAGFWFRPALVLAYSLIVMVAGLALAFGVPAKIGEARTMLRAGECGAGASEGCLRSMRARLDGPYYRRGPGDAWDVVPADSVEEPFEKVRVPTADGRRLEDGAFVVALVWRHMVVALRSADGELIETDEYGHRAGCSSSGSGCSCWRAAWSG
jgi:hypothetical protein